MECEYIYGVYPVTMSWFKRIDNDKAIRQSPHSDPIISIHRNISHVEALGE